MILVISKESYFLRQYITCPIAASTYRRAKYAIYLSNEHSLSNKASVNCTLAHPQLKGSVCMAIKNAATMYQSAEALPYTAM